MARLFSLLSGIKPRRPRLLAVEPGRRLRLGDRHRVAARVDGTDIWFASEDAELTPAAEAFATALLVPHLQTGRPLVVAQPVCARWRDNIHQAAALLTRWWNYQPLDVRCTTTSDVATADGTGLCFTAGVDSFYSLLRCAPDADTLVFARGYDVDLRDRKRADWGERTVRAIAAETGRRAVIVTTNLRRHPTFRLASWERTHGSALAALGHVLRGTIGRLQISASEQIESTYHWGSRWDLDPLFSSASLHIEHCGAAVWRTQKLWEIAHEPLVQRHLRVCWQPARGEGNCGHCEKCVRTMLTLESCGQLNRYSTLKPRTELSELVERVPAVPFGSIVTYESMLARGLPPLLRAAVQRLLNRTRVALAA